HRPLPWLVADRCHRRPHPVEAGARRADTMSYDKILVPVAPGHGEETTRALEVARALLSPDGTVSAVTVLEDLPRYMASEAYVVEPVFEESQQAAVDQVVQELSDLGVD